MKRISAYVLGVSLALGALALPQVANAQSAAQLDARLNTVALWQSSNGLWRACGPYCFRMAHQRLYWARSEKTAA